MIQDNPWGREYTSEEWAAARRVGLRSAETTLDKDLTVISIPSGPLIWASPGNPLIPEGAAEAARIAADWQVVLAAWDRERVKPLEEDQ